MKKALLLFCLAISLFASSAFAQEVRGCTTRRVIYEGPEYTNPYSDKPSTRYYGWEITNHNSFKISVDITLFAQGGDGGLRTNEAVPVKIQSIILKPGESYIFKREEHCCTKVDHEPCQINSSITIYYVEYKAYKLN